MAVNHKAPVNSERLKCDAEMRLAKAIAPSIPRTNILRYSIVRQVLFGVVGGEKIAPISAPSGAGQDGIHRGDVPYSNWLPSKKATKTERGGVIMPGWWIVVPADLDKGEKLKGLNWGSAPTNNSLRILPYQLLGEGKNYNRNSFYIHGTGGKGSDGCILMAPAHRNKLLSQIVKNKGAWLQVFLSQPELNDWLEQKDRFNRTA